MPSDLDTWRCGRCGRILARLNLAPGSVVEVKCACNAFNTLQITLEVGVTSKVVDMTRLSVLR